MKVRKARVRTVRVRRVWDSKVKVRRVRVGKVKSRKGPHYAESLGKPAEGATFWLSSRLGRKLPRGYTLNSAAERPSLW